jgi:hypothetical protein
MRHLSAIFTRSLPQGLIAKPDHLCCFRMRPAENIFRRRAVSAVFLLMQFQDEFQDESISSLLFDDLSAPAGKKIFNLSVPSCPRNFECANVGVSVTSRCKD